MCWYQLNMWSLFACSWCPSQTKDNKNVMPTNPAFTLNHFLSWYRNYQFDSSGIKNRWSFCVCDLKCPWSNQALVLCETLHCEGSSWTWKKLETVSTLLFPRHLRSSNLHISRSRSFSVNISSIFSQQEGKSGVVTCLNYLHFLFRFMQTLKGFKQAKISIK